MGNRHTSVRVGGATLDAEVADSMWALTAGLMFRRRLAPDGGLLLTFPRTGDWGIHMWFVRFPLDLVFLDERGVILLIRGARPGAWGFRPGLPVRYVLEVNFGWCARNNVSLGDRLDPTPA